VITLPTLAVLAIGAALPAGSESDLAVAWLRDGRVEIRAVAPAAVTDQAPLGSVWKLFVYAYLVERGQETPAYRCEIPRRPGDEYCCEPGQSVERDAALARSCATFFAPSRLKIEPSEWHAFWSTRVGARAAWLSDLQRLQPHTIVPVPELLQALAAVPPVARTAASRALLPVLLDGYGQGAVRHLGGSVRVKTFTWPHPRQQGASIGGGAGWLIDGTPVWFSARGASRTVLTRDAARLSATLPAPSRAPEDEPCVVVDYFERYPIRQVDEMTSRTPAAPGPLRGRHRVTFENGNTLVFQASGEMRLDRAGARPRLRARLPLSEYVARVLDREADPGPTQAARALAVVARTWLVRNAVFESGCFQVADSTRAQRVSASPASAEARAAALFTDGLVLKGQDARYHLDTDERGVLSWRQAVEQDRAGLAFDAILTHAFSRASLAAITGEQECRRLPDVETWLARAALRWKRTLSGQPGFEAPAQPPAVCGLDHGSPYVDRAHLRVYVRGRRSRDERVTLAHEYVHLGFRYHPRGDDEAFVERTALWLEE
jgi:uncharacterized protein YfaQ (DUF2300 family)